MGTKEFNELFQIKELSDDCEFDMESEEDFSDGEENYEVDESPLEIEGDWMDETEGLL